MGRWRGCRRWGITTCRSATTIRWRTKDACWGEIYVQVGDQPEKLFRAGPAGSQTAAWINKGAKHEFRLYAGKEHEKVLARVVVTMD